MWYKVYVLLVLLLACVSNLATRNLPSYLVSVAAPGCEEICAGVTYQDVCPSPVIAAGLHANSSMGDQCLACRSTPKVTRKGEEAVAGFYNLADGTCLRYWEYGILIGYGFSAVFAVGAFTAGHVCDRKPRVAVASVALMAWSVATALQSSAHSFMFLLGCRAVVGLAQAFGMPATISLAADYFSERRNAAVAILSVGGAYLGAGSASFAIIVADALGWRWATLLAGLLGIALVPIMYFTVKEPARTEWSAPCDVSIVLEELFEKSRLAPPLLVATSAKLLAVCSLGAFLPVWYSRRGLLGFNSSSYACWNALVITAGGLISAFLGERLNAILKKRDARVPCYIGVFGSLASLPLLCGVLLPQSFFSSMMSYFFLLLLSESWFEPTVGLLQASVRCSVRGQALSVFLVASTLAANIGPAIIGFVDPGGQNIGICLLVLCMVANVVAAAAFAWTAREITLDPVAAARGSKEQTDVPDPGTPRSSHWALF